MFRNTLLALMSLFTLNLSAQPQMADTFRSEGKIYVVIAVIGLIFAAIVIFLVVLERRIKKIEDTQNSKV